MLPRSMTKARLTGVPQLQRAHVVLVRRLPTVLNLGLPVTTTKKVISPEATSNYAPPAFPSLLRTAVLTALSEGRQQLETAGWGRSGGLDLSRCGFDLKLGDLGLVLSFLPLKVSFGE